MREADVALTVTRTRADFFNAVLLAERKNIWTIATIAILPLAIATFLSRFGEDADTRTIIFTIVLLCSSIGAVTGVVSMAWLKAKRAAASPGATSETRFLFTADGVGVEGAGASGFEGWSAWRNALEGDGHILLRSRSGLFCVLPKAGQNVDLLDRLRAILSTNIKGQVRLRRGGP